MSQTHEGPSLATDTPRQQDIERDLGMPLGTLCAPTAFYAEAQRLDYPSGRLGQAQFVGEVVVEVPMIMGDGYVGRADLSQRMRDLHGLAVVSWNRVDQPADVALMQQAGYLRTDREERFFRNEVLIGDRPRDVLDLVHTGYRVIATMRTGFAANRGLHAVILYQSAVQDRIHVSDPDERNDRTGDYSEDEIRQGLQEGGACSIVLPPEAEQPTS